MNINRYTPIIPILNGGRLAELRLWLAQSAKRGRRGRKYNSTPLPEHIENGVWETAEVWVALLNEIPHHRKPQGAEPIALAKAILKHPWCASNLSALTSIEVGAPADVVNGDKYYSLYSILASIPGGSTLVASLIREHGIDFSSGYGDSIVDYVLEKAVRYSTLADVKVLAALVEERHEHHNPFETGSNNLGKAAFLNHRRDVFLYAVERRWVWTSDFDLIAQWPRPQTESRWRLRALLEGGIVCRAHLAKILKNYAFERGGTAATQNNVLSLFLGGGGEYFRPWLAPEGRGLTMFLRLLAYNPERVAPLRRSIIPGDWWRRCDQLDEWARGEDVLERVPACFGNPCRRATIPVLESLFGQARFGRAPETTQRLAISYVLALQVKGQWCPECQQEMSEWFSRVHRRWPGLDYRLIYERALFRGAPHYSEEVLIRRWIDYVSMGGHDVVRVLCRYGDPSERTAIAIAKFVRLYMVVLKTQETLRRETWQNRSRVVAAELSMLPPSTVLRTGGSAYRDIGSSWGLRVALFRGPPVHASPERLGWYATHPCTLAPKADGIFYEGPLPAEVSPPLPGRFSQVTFQAERMELDGRAVYLVFDWMDEEFADTRLSERMDMLRKLHPVLQAAPDATVTDLLASSDARVLWWPKRLTVFGAGDPSLLLRQLETTPDVPYPTDGWILVPEVTQDCLRREVGQYPPTLKVKPAHEMTADALWTGAAWRPVGFTAPPPPDTRANVVWRCEWTPTGWAAREGRPEKRRANPPELIQDLEAWHAAPWTPADLIPYVSRRHYQSTVVNLGLETNVFLSSQRRAIRSWLRRQGVADCARVLDLGCGRGAQRIRGPEWVGIDIDPAAICEARIRREQDTWLWCDAATFSHPLTGAPYPAIEDSPFDAFVSIHSFHGATRPEPWIGWRDAITLRAAPGARLLIVMVDIARLFSGPGLEEGHTVMLPDHSWARSLRRRVVLSPTATAYEVRTSLAWATSATAPVTETFTSAGAVIANFEAAGWTLESLEAAQEFDPDAEGWDVWRQAECRIVLRAP